jgi:hypothetical protein
MQVWVEAVDIGVGFWEGKETWEWDHIGQYTGAEERKGRKVEGVRQVRGVGARETCSGYVEGRVRRR